MSNENIFPLTDGMKQPGMQMNYLRGMGNKMVDALVEELDAREEMINELAQYFADYRNQMMGDRGYLDFEPWTKENAMGVVLRKMKGFIFDGQ